MRKLSFRYNRLLVSIILLSVFSTVLASAAFAAADDRIYYFNMSGTAEGNFILVQSNGHWGLIDAGHRNSDTIQDANGNVYYVGADTALSSQIPYRNGRDAAQYMVNRLGVTHLDFIVGTHAHSDHIGGVPEIAATTFTDANGRARSLVDNNTTYYYKTYQHINSAEDDLGAEVDPDSWHNQAFAYQAVNTMKNAGASLVDLSQVDGIHGAPGNPYGDYVTFTMGDMTFRLYNLFTKTNNENTNSIVAAISNGNYTVVSLADSNIVNNAIDSIVSAISKDYGTADIVVAGHHGFAGSNTKGVFDSLQPDYYIVSNGAAQSSWVYTESDLALARPYAEGNYGTKFYGTGLSQYAVMTDLSGNVVQIYSLGENGQLSDALYSTIQSTSWNSGWVSWQNYGYTLWAYYQNGNLIRNAWAWIDGNCYYFDRNGIMASQTWVDGYYVGISGAWIPNYQGPVEPGWVDYGGGRWAYQFEDSSWAYNWLALNGKWYYFGTDGWMKRGWQWVGDYCYFFYDDGSMAADTWVDGYYVDPWGVWIPNYQGPVEPGWVDYGGGNLAYRFEDGSWAYYWLPLDGKWYYFGTDGWMKRGWQWVGNNCYFFYDDGSMAVDTWIDGYYVDGTGVWVQNLQGAVETGWVDYGNGQWAYLQEDGSWAYGWKEIDGEWFYFDNEGWMAADTWIDGYYVNASGVWEK